MRLNPLTVRKLRRFRSIKRGYYSFLLLIGLVLLSFVAELFVNNRALVVRYEGNFYFPTYSGFLPGTTFGYEYSYETNYRQLKEDLAATPGDGNWVIMPLVPYNPYENSYRDGVFPPTSPSWEDGHYLGTDTTGRDILARLVYGFRTAILFSIGFMLAVYLLGITIGCAMGYFGGWFDLSVQRIIEIWANIPFLYIVIIVSSLVPSDLGLTTRILLLLVIMVLFSWTGMTYFMRTATYREKARDYAAAAQVLGANTGRIIFSHILPNTISTVVTFMPFTMVTAITAVTALDFLGFGLPPPTPSIGELLKQGLANLNAPWIAVSAIITLIFTLTLVTFVGEAVREAFDPKKFTVYS